MDSVLTTSSIDSMISAYVSSEKTRLITPLQTKKSWYQNLSTAYGTLSSKLSSLKTLLESFQQTGNDSIFRVKAATSSKSDFISASASATAASGSYNLNVSQLAKNDMLISRELDSATANAISGTHNFVIKTGDGEGGEYTSNIEVTFSESETNQSVMEKIRDAVNSDKAVINSDYKSASASAGGPTTFKINIDGTEKEISLNGGGTYDELLDEAVEQITSNVPGVTAEKVVDPDDPGSVKLKITVKDVTKSISITSGTGYDIVSDLNIAANNEKAASGTVTASSFRPVSGKTQFSLSSRSTGVDFRITGLSDAVGSTALASLGLNLDVDRPLFDQSTSPDTAGYVYADVSENSALNSKFTFNGLNFQRNSNVVDDIASGITFTLKSVMTASDPDVNVSVDIDTTAVKSSIEDFITKFNNVYTNIKSQSAFASGSSRGVFAGDTNASFLSNMLGSVAYSSIPGIQSGDIKMLSQLGITFNGTTGLSISDSTRLEDEIKNHSSQVEALFNSSDGIANSLVNKIKPYLGSGGFLALGQARYDKTVNSLNDKNTALQKRIDKSSDVLRNRYQQLQAQLASLLTVQNMFS